MEPRSSRRSFSLQWHITALCDQRCKHCYAADPKTYEKELRSPLTTAQCKEVVNSLTAFCEKLGANPHIAFTGGDPLLRSDFFEILEHARSRGVIVSILGNPFHLDERTLKRLKAIGIRGYQISIDGMRETHDYLRKPGSFDASVKALKDLKSHGIRTVVMFTISKVNAKDLIPVMRLVDKLKVDAFAFARVCGFGNGRELAKDEFTPEEYRAMLLKAYEEEKRLKKRGSTTVYNRKDHLWALLLSELGEEKYEPTSDGVIYGGCSIGCRSMCLLANGTAFACRRFYSPIGRLPDQSVEEVFLSKRLGRYRDTKFEKCSGCELFQFCRGCPGVAFGKTKEFGSPDPQCWKELPSTT